MRTVKTIVLGIGITFVLQMTSYAFDGNRKGFVAGFGLGFAPVTQWTSNYSGFHVSQVGGAGNGLIGYAWNNKNMLVLETIVAVCSPSSLKSSAVYQSLDGARWYHYFGDGQRQLFSTIGVGRITFDTEYQRLYGTGFGYCAGFGYEIFKQIQIGTYYFGGHSFNQYNIMADHNAVCIIATVIAY